MSYTTTPIANRLGCNRGWTFQLIPQNANIPDTTSMVYLKSYFILKEYLRFYQVNLLSFSIQPLTPTISLVHLLVYKHIRYSRKKPHPIFIDGLNKKGYFKVLNVLRKQQGPAAIKSISMIGPKKGYQNITRTSLVQKSKSRRYKMSNLASKKIKQAWKKKKPYRLKRNVRFKPQTIAKFMSTSIRKSIEFKRKFNWVFRRQLCRLGISPQLFCTTLHNIQGQELVLCMKNVLNNLSMEKPKINLKRVNKIDENLMKKSFMFSANVKTKKSSSLGKLKVLLNSGFGTRLWVAKKIMISWKKINCDRNQFYVNHYGITLKSFLNENVCPNNNMTAIMLSKGKEILEDQIFAKQFIFSMLGLHQDTVKANKSKSNKEVQLYISFVKYRKNLNQSKAGLLQTRTQKFDFPRFEFSNTKVKRNKAKSTEKLESYRATVKYGLDKSKKILQTQVLVLKQNKKTVNWRKVPSNWAKCKAIIEAAEGLFMAQKNRVGPMDKDEPLLHNIRQPAIYLQNFALKQNIKRKKEICKPILNNQLQLNYLFESYLQNICKVPSVVKVVSTSSQVWLKKIYNKFKSKPRLKRAAEGRFFKRLLFAFISAERYMAPQLIADLIAHELTIPRKHKPLLRNINALFDAVHSRYILGYKIVVDGKLNGVMKSTKQIIKFKGKDKMPVQEFHKRVLYALGVSRNYTGVFGVRVWLYY